MYHTIVFRDYSACLTKINATKAACKFRSFVPCHTSPNFLEAVLIFPGGSQTSKGIVTIIAASSLRSGTKTIKRTGMSRRCPRSAVHGLLLLLLLLLLLHLLLLLRRQPSRGWRRSHTQEIAVGRRLVVGRSTVVSRMTVHVSQQVATARSRRWSVIKEVARVGRRLV